MTKIIPSLGKLGHQEVLDVFLEIVEAIPSNSILRDQSGVLKPHYSNAKSLFDAGKLWNDVARLAHIATSKLTIFGGGEVVEIKAIKEEILETLRSEMRTSTDHEATLRTFSLDADRRFEAVFGGRFGFKDHDDIYHFNLRNEITAKYLHHLKPDWLDEEVLKQLGLIIVLAIHLADQTLRDRVKSNSAGEAVPVYLGDHPARTLATIRVMAEVMCERKQKSLMPTDEAVLSRYMKFEFRLAADAAVSDAALKRAQEIDAENKANSLPGKRRKPLVTIYEELVGQMARDYQERHLPKSVADIPQASLKEIIREIFSNRLHSVLEEAIMQGSFRQQLDEILADPVATRRIDKLIRDSHRLDRPPLFLPCLSGLLPIT